MMGILGERLVKLLLAVTILLFLLTVTTDAARGGSRGGSRVRTGTSSSSGTRINGQTWRTAMTAGTLYGSTAYMRRSRYYGDPDEEPEICHNIYDKDDNQTIYDYFICPLPNEPDDYIYCCGDDDREHCCTFFDDAGRLAGVVIGIIAFCILLVIGGVFLFKICRR